MPVFGLHTVIRSGQPVQLQRWTFSSSLGTYRPFSTRKMPTRRLFAAEPNGKSFIAHAFLLLNVSRYHNPAHQPVIPQMYHHRDICVPAFAEGLALGFRCAVDTDT